MSGYFDNESINNDIKEYLQRRISAYGQLQYSYLLMSKKSPLDIAIISTYSVEWQNKYKAQKLHIIDPVIIVARNRVLPFSWDDNVVIHERTEDSEVFNLAEKHNIINGYTFVLHDNNNLALLSLIDNNNNNNKFYHIINKNRDQLQMLLIITHQKIIALYAAKGININIQPQSIENEKKFSARENEVLYWASLGKTYPEISIILGIKQTTVKFHIGNVVKKLGVLNAKHAIRLGIELNLIKPI